jgi:ATP-dependent DNA helicase RecG
VTLDDPLTVLRGVGPRRASDLARAGLHTVGDLLTRFPFRYDDRTTFRDLGSLQPGESVSIVGTVAGTRLRLTRRPGFKLVEVMIHTDTGVLRAVWLNQPYMLDVFRRDLRVVLFGQVEQHPPAGWQITNPQYEILDDDGTQPLHMGRIVPVYEKAGTVTCRIQRNLVSDALSRLPPDVDGLLPSCIADSLGLPDFRTALAQSHFPDPSTPADQLAACRTPAQVRLILEEFFQYQMGLLLRRRTNRAGHKVIVPRVDDRVRGAARAVLPFRLTAGQRTALKEIVDDMVRPEPMHRLLQGDVGAGKTVVALMAAVVAMENGLQVALMAPTEILAEQHVVTIAKLFERSPYRVALLTGGVSAADRRGVLADLASGEIQLVVGTHALVQERVAFRQLGFVIVDEQHRFGVMQRAVLQQKGWCPDVLVMTATPIPRTLALTAYGDLDVSVMRDLPPGRTPIRTMARPHTVRDEVYADIREQVAQGHQVYVVFPLVEESSKVDLRAATEMADHLAQAVMPESRLALLHGRLRPDQKDHIMRAFAAGEVDVLVSTTVIEVGIDVPNATMMVIEHAERFGLAQLHQLRGRVGRGPAPSSCVLVYQTPAGEQAEARLQALVDTTDGFVIAERDLELRGPGDFFGTRQSGAPTLRSGDLWRDRALMDDARRYAGEVLEGPGGEAVATEVQRVWADRFGLVDVG